MKDKAGNPQHELTAHTAVDAEHLKNMQNGCSFGGWKGLLQSTLVMTGLSKSEHKKAAREEELIDLAVELINELGFAGLSLEKLTAKSSYSKGTIYNHFSSKEDCLSALCIRAVSSILALFKQAVQFEGHLREKAVAIHYAYQLYTRHEPILFMAVLSSKAPGVREKTSPARMKIMDSLEFEINHFSDEMLRMAIKEGSLQLPTHISVEALTFANWAMSFGSNILVSNAKEALAVNRLDPNTVILQNISLLHDGMNWLPLSKDWDYQKTWQRIETEIFP
jgi:AcrR family transcriptional regulator